MGDRPPDPANARTAPAAFRSYAVRRRAAPGRAARDAERIVGWPSSWRCWRPSGLLLAADLVRPSPSPGWSPGPTASPTQADLEEVLAGSPGTQHLDPVDQDDVIDAAGGPALGARPARCGGACRATLAVDFREWRPLLEVAVGRSGRRAAMPAPGAGRGRAGPARSPAHLVLAGLPVLVGSTPVREGSRAAGPGAGRDAERPGTGFGHGGCGARNGQPRRFCCCPRRGIRYRPAGRRGHPAGRPGGFRRPPEPLHGGPRPSRARAGNRSAFRGPDHGRPAG